MRRRARSLSVVGILLGGAIGVLSATQTWLYVSLTAGGDPLAVPGASAVPVLAPLSLAALALGLALSIVGIVLRYIFGAITVAAGATLVWLIGVVAFTHPLSAVAASVTTATGISGKNAVAALVSSIHVTGWPYAALVGAVILLAAGVFTIATARGWRRSGRRYATSVSAGHSATSDAPLDAIDSWDELSRGEDPTG